LLILACTSIGLPAHAQEPPIKYSIEAGDTLWLIATRFYNAPGAYSALYKHNKAALDAANKDHPKGPNWIFPSTVINLPLEIRVGDTSYTRRATPMNVDLATEVASPDGIDLKTLLRVTRAKILPRWMKPNDAPSAPVTRSSSVLSASKAKRESPPEWFSKPDSGVEQCAKSVCVRFEQLCYFECLSIAKRFHDGERQNLCQELQKSPRSAAVALPLQVDGETREFCAELIQ
jgi:hypothetical protein